jgi:hypothetical protein
VSERIFNCSRSLQGALTAVIARENHLSALEETKPLGSSREGDFIGNRPFSAWSTIRSEPLVQICYSAPRLLGLFGTWHDPDRVTRNICRRSSKIGSQRGRPRCRTGGFRHIVSPMLGWARSRSRARGCKTFWFS